jgi:hypothetical protein
MSTRARVLALLIALGLATGLAGCGTKSADRPHPAAKIVTTTSASIASRSTVSTPTTASAPRAPETAESSASETRQPTSPTQAPKPSTPRIPKPRFVCPQGGVEEAIALQRAVDEGHQPWRTSPTDVATACTFPDGAVEALGVNTYRVSRVSTGQTVIVEEVQPVRPGPGGIWVVSKVTPR